METLKEKQEYYRYDQRPLRFKIAPELSRDLVAAMKREGLDKRYRFNWGGVVIVREEPNSPSYQIARGSREACHVVRVTIPEHVKPILGSEVLVEPEVREVLQPRYIFERARQARGYFYYNDLNQKVTVTRESFVPPDKIARVDYRYVDFGVLRWFLEQRTEGETLVDSKVYSAKDRVPDHEWVTIAALNSQGLYYEPGLEMIEVLRQREWENKNLDLKMVARNLMARLDEARAAREQKEDDEATAQFHQHFDDVMREYEKQGVQVDLGSRHDANRSLIQP